MYAQLGQQPLARTTETSLQPRQGTRSCLSAQPPDLADAPIQHGLVSMSLSIVLFPYSKRTAVTRSLVSRHGQSNVLSPFRAHYSWNNPLLLYYYKVFAEVSGE